MARLFSKNNKNYTGIRETLDHILRWSIEKGFRPNEVQLLMKDVINCLIHKGTCNVKTLNQELEALGWGIEIIDEIIYKQMVFLSRNLEFFDLEKYF